LADAEALFLLLRRDSRDLLRRGRQTMTVNYKFNQYRVSGEDALQWSDNAMNLMRSGRGFWTGHMMAELLYRSQIEALSFTEINQMYKHIPFQTIKSILSGSFSPETYRIFTEMKETEPEMLQALFTITIKTKGEINND
jgi:hypothetical protein